VKKIKGTKNDGLFKILNSAVEYFKTHRLIGLISLAVLTMVIILTVFLLLPKNPAEVGTKQSQETTQTDISDLSIIIPQNSFPYPKSFTVKELPSSEETLRLKELGRFSGNIYELIPTDGRNDLALEPMTFQYIFPTEFYFGTEYNNVELGYIEDKNSPIVRFFSGAELKTNNQNRLVVEIKAFHGSVIGLKVSNPQKMIWGLEKTIEKKPSLKPDILLVHGIDQNFLGFLPNTITNANPQGNNIWEITFPDRTIWSYN